MKVRKIALIILSTIMGGVWVVLVVSQLHLMRRVFDNEKQLFQNRLDGAVFQAFEELEASDAFQLDSSATAPAFDVQRVDSVFSRALQRNRIEESFGWGLYCSEREQFVYVSPGIDTALFQTAGFAYPMKRADDPSTAFVFPQNYHDDILFLTFPDLHRQFSWDVYMGTLLLIVLLAVVLLCFILVIALISKESRVVRMRSKVMNHIIHELKTPITTISLATQLLRDKSVDKDSETADSYLSMIDGESKSLQGLVEEVLMLVRSEKLPKRERREISVHELLREVVDVHRLLLNECQAEVVFDLQAERDVILGDRMHLFNAFSNLVDNAIKYRNGALVLQVQTRNDKNTIEIRIADNGIGIDEKDQKWIFEPFSRINTDNPNYVKGFGLGLSYVKYVADYHYGKIKVESKMGKGATFILSLPLRMS